jgi:fatty acid desaturase
MKPGSTISGARLGELREFRVGRPIGDLAWNWCAIAMAQTAFWLKPTIIVGIVCAAIIGIHLHRLLILGHDSAHHLLFRNRVINDLVGNVFCFFLVGATVEGFRDWHLRHHRFVGTPKDPELIVKQG